MINNSIRFQTPSELRKYIESLRNELVTIGQTYGLNSKEAIDKSQELDQYISICQICCPKENRK